MVVVGIAAAGISGVGAQTASTQISVDAAANRHPINPNIYGVAYGTQAQLADLNVPLNRRGGNNTSRYNWQLNADNRASDWFFESLPYASATAGDDADQFVSSSKAAGAQAMITIPTIGWVAKLGSGRAGLGSFSVKKYGAQQNADGDNGNGVHTNGTNITGNDPNDADVPADSTFQQGWVNHLTSKFGLAQNGGVRYYIMDNEPSIWSGTHRDVHPVGPKMDEIRDKMIDYGSKVKQADPGALIVGPEEWGWPGYFYSGYDQDAANANGWTSFPDKAAHGNQDYLPYLLDQIRQHDASTGQRTLDVFTVHYYPQSGEFSDDTSSTTQKLRNKSTRSLWDPNYVDASWISDTVMLIPRLRNWVNTYYPGTQIGITEYNWGAEGHINGATTLADIWGIFGREGLDMATYWTIPNTGTPAYNAMKLYRNYDGAKSTFGDTSVSATVPNPDNLSAFAAQRSSDGALTIMVINKNTAATTGNISLANYTVTGAAQAWQLTSTNKIARLADVPVSGNALSTSLPAQSITLFVLGGSAGSTPVTVGSLALSPASVTGGTSSTGTVTLSGAAPAGGTSVTLSSSSTSVTVPASITVAAGATSATFTATTKSVTTATTATVTASANGSSKSATLSVQPAAAPAPSVSALALNPASVTGGSSSTGTVTLSGAAPTGGTVVTLTSNSASVTVPGSVTVAAGGTSATFTATTTSVSATTTATITASANSSSKTATLTVQPAAAPAPTVTGLAFNPATVTSGSTSQGTVTLSGAAPAGGTAVTLTSSSTAVTVPGSVTVAAGATSATFTATAGSVSSSTTASVTASVSGSGVQTQSASNTATLTVQPAPSVTVTGLTLTPASVTGGSTSKGKVTLSGAAPTGGTVVTLSSSSTAATVPASVKVAAGATTASFTINTAAVSAATTATITASANGSSKTATLTVQPVPVTATFSDATSTSPAIVLRNTSATVTSKVTCKTGSLTGGIIDVEIYNAAGTQVKQSTFTGKTFAAGQSRSVSFAWTPATRGTYTIKVGVFDQNWNLLYWDDAAATLTVN